MIAGTRVRESWSNCKHCTALWDRKQQAQGSETTEKHVEHDSCYHTSTAPLGNSNRTHLPLKRLNSLNPLLLWKSCKLSLKIKTQHWIMMKHHFLDHTENSVFTEGLNKGKSSLKTHLLFCSMWPTMQETKGWQFIGAAEGGKFKTVTWQGPIKNYLSYWAASWDPLIPQESWRFWSPRDINKTEVGKPSLLMLQNLPKDYLQ